MHPIHKTIFVFVLFCLIFIVSLNQSTSTETKDAVASDLSLKSTSVSEIMEPSSRETNYNVDNCTSASNCSGTCGTSVDWTPICFRGACICDCRKTSSPTFPAKECNEMIPSNDRDKCNVFCSSTFGRQFNLCGKPSQYVYCTCTCESLQVQSKSLLQIADIKE